MTWYYKLHEVPQVNLNGLVVSLFRGADLPGFYPLFAEADDSAIAEKEMEDLIVDVVAYDAPLRGAFIDRDEAVRAEKKEFDKLMRKARQTVLV